MPTCHDFLRVAATCGALLTGVVRGGSGRTAGHTASSGNGRVKCSEGDSIFAYHAQNDSWAHAVLTEQDVLDGIFVLQLDDGSKQRRRCEEGSVERDGQVCICEYVRCSVGDHVRVDGENATINSLHTDGSIVVTWDRHAVSETVAWHTVTNGDGRCRPSHFLHCAVGDRVRFRPSDSLPDITATIHSICAGGNMQIDWEFGRVPIAELDVRDKIRKDFTRCPKSPVNCGRGDRAYDHIKSENVTIMQLGSDGAVAVEYDDGHILSVPWIHVMKDEAYCLSSSARCAVGDRVSAFPRENRWADATIRRIDASDGTVEVTWDQGGEHQVVPWDLVGKDNIACGLPPAPAPAPDSGMSSVCYVAVTAALGIGLIAMAGMCVAFVICDPIYGFRGGARARAAEGARRSYLPGPGASSWALRPQATGRSSWARGLGWARGGSALASEEVKSYALDEVKSYTLDEE